MAANPSRNVWQIEKEIYLRPNTSKHHEERIKDDFNIWETWSFDELITKDLVVRTQIILYFYFFLDGN